MPSINFTTLTGFLIQIVLYINQKAHIFFIKERKTKFINSFPSDAKDQTETTSSIKNPECEVASIGKI